MENELNVLVAVRENGTALKDKLLKMGVSADIFAGENTIWRCDASEQGGKVCLSFDEGAVLFFCDENAAADFLYTVICHCRYLQMMTVDFGGMLGILGESSWDRCIRSTDWAQQEEIPFYTSVLSANVLPDVDDPEISFQYMNETDNLLMERFAEDSQIMMIFGEDVTQERRKLFWLEAANV